MGHAVNDIPHEDIRCWVSAILFQLSALQRGREKKVILTLSFVFEQVMFLPLCETVVTLIVWEDDYRLRGR